jgi:hypothetical protein
MGFILPIRKGGPSELCVERGSVRWRLLVLLGPLNLWPLDSGQSRSSSCAAGRDELAKQQPPTGSVTGVGCVVLGQLLASLVLAFLLGLWQEGNV